MDLIRIAIPDFVSSTFIPLIAASELGFFREEGQEVEIMTIPAPRDVESLRDGAVDFCAGTAHAPLMVFPGWRGVRLLAAVVQGTPWMLVVRDELAKRGEIEAVKGRRIAADRGPDNIFTYLLGEAGIDLERDRVEIVRLTTDDANPSFGVVAGRALAEEKVDGVWANALGCELAVHLSRAAIVLDTRRGDGPPGAGSYSFAALVTTEANIEAKRESIEAVIRALNRAQSEIRRHPRSVAEIALRSFPQLEAELMHGILRRDAEFYHPFISTKAIDEMNRLTVAVGLLPAPIPYEQIVATQFQGLWANYS